MSNQMPYSVLRENAKKTTWLSYLVQNMVNLLKKSNETQKVWLH